MTRQEIICADMDRRQSRFDITIEVLIVSLLTFMPFAFGAVQAWSREIVIAFSSAIVLVFLAKLVFCPNCKFVWTWGFLPVGIFVFLILFQMLQLPSWLIGIISPNTIAL